MTERNYTYVAQIVHRIWFALGWFQKLSKTKSHNMKLVCILELVLALMEHNSGVLYVIMAYKLITLTRVTVQVKCM